jgi:acyl-CoA thioester hydrolase
MPRTDSDPHDEEVSLTLRVRYFETDQMRVAHHAHYLVWFEAARSEFCRVRGIDYSQMERDGYFMPILEARCRYRRPARYDDELTITVRVVERTRRTLKLHYVVVRGEEELAEGETTQMLVDGEGRPRSFPAEIAKRFDAG